MDGTPIYDIKPYIPFTDCHIDAKGGITDEHKWEKLSVEFTREFLIKTTFNDDELNTLKQILELDPRPHFQDEESRIYGMTYQQKDIKFQVAGNILRVIEELPL